MTYTAFTPGRKPPIWICASLPHCLPASLCPTTLKFRDRLNSVDAPGNMNTDAHLTVSPAAGSAAGSGRGADLI